MNSKEAQDQIDHDRHMRHVTNTVKHTPGPWIARTFKCLNDTLPVEICFTLPPSSSPGCVGRIALVYGEGADTKGVHDNQTANAHLISAAPDMLAALKALADFQIGDFADEAIYRERIRDLCLIKRSARVAIARAEGRE